MGIYYDIFALLSDFIYGAGATLDNFQNLIITEAATVFSMAAAAFPLVVVYWLARWIISIAERM